MKKYIVLSLMIVVSIVVAQEKHSVLVLHPQTPRVGETISIAYTPAENLLSPKGEGDVICEALLNRDTLDPLLIETPLQKDGDRWVGSFPLQDPMARYIVYRIISADKTDDNTGMLWGSFVYGANKKPVKGSHLAAGMLWKDGRFYNFKRTSNPDSAKSELEKEKKLYPTSWEAATGLWDISFKIDPRDPKIKKEIDASLIKYKKDEKKLLAIIQWYEKLGDSTKATSMRKKEITRNPKGRVALETRQLEVVGVADKTVRIEKIESLLRDFPEIPDRMKQSYLQTLFSLYRSLKEYDNAIESISRLEKPTPDMYNALAWPLIEKGEHLDKATSWAKKAVEMSKQIEISDKPTYVRVKDWKENNTYMLTMALDTYGTGLLKQGNVDEAMQCFTEAYDSTKGSEPDINTHYLDALMKGKKYDTALDIGFSCIREAKDSPEMIALLKDAYVKRTGADKQYDSLDAANKNEFEKRLSAAQKIRHDAMMKKLSESRMNTPAPEFTLKNFQGVPVTLSALKGKVLIVDFWATWCGPCKMSFPFLQTVYEKYQANKDVVFLAVNTWERQSDYAAQVANAKKFIEENKYTFPVLIDEKKDDQYDVVTRYDVEGIPTKFILDKKGNIAWKTVGFDNGQAMIDEMTEEINLLLGE